MSACIVVAVAAEPRCSVRHHLDGGQNGGQIVAVARAPDAISVHILPTAVGNPRTVARGVAEPFLSR